ncbi:MAG: hypothetical protein ACLFQM_05010 [Fidelibacterota bacterium]
MNNAGNNTGLKVMRKIFIVFIILANMTMAYEQDLFRHTNFFKDQYLRNYVEYNLYDLSQNPAFFHAAYPSNYNLFRIFGNKNNNGHHRRFDPERTENLGLDLLWIRYLSQKSIIASGVEYYDSYHMNVYHSLEKDFYNNYFSYSDTTEGDIDYNGPKLWFLYHHNMTDNISLGLQLNYGVERGLKDIYTECQTISRDMDVTAGLSIQSDSKLSRAGVAYRYFNRQSKYEAVKKYVSAMTRTWYGFHLFMEENPRSLSRKNSDREGYEIIISAEQIQLAGTDFGYRVSGSFGQHKNNIKVGAVKDLHQRAYWQREGWDVKSNLFYINELLNIQAYYTYRSFSDWGEPKGYDVLSLEKDEMESRFGALSKVKLGSLIESFAGFEISKVNIEYEEYTAGFTYDDELKSNNYIFGSNFNLNSVSTIYLSGNAGNYETDFLWPEAGSFDFRGVKLGYSKQFVLGKIDLGLNYTVFNPVDIDRQNEEFGIELFFIR